MIITHFIITQWNDGQTTRYGWNSKRNGRPNSRNLAKVVGSRNDFLVADLVRADDTLVARVTN